MKRKAPTVFIRPRIPRQETHPGNGQDRLTAGIEHAVAAGIAVLLLAVSGANSSAIAPAALLLIVAAIAFLALALGMRPGLLASGIVGFGAVRAALSQPHLRWPPADMSDFRTAVAFTAATFVVAVIAGALRRAPHRLTRPVQIAEDSRAQLEAVIQAMVMVEGVVVFDLEGRVELMSATVASFINQPEPSTQVDATLLWTEYDLFGEDGREVPATERPSARALRGETFTNWPLTMRRRSNGEQSHAIFSGRPVRDHSGKQVLCVVTYHDVSAATVAERALRASERRFHAIADNIPQLAWIADAHGKVLWYNDRWVDYTGATIDQGPTWYDVHHPDHRERVQATIRHAIETSEPWEITTPLRNKNGQYRWFLSRGIGIPGDGGDIQWFGTATDVTERVETEEALRESESRYRRAVEALREADQRKTDFLSMLSHELRNPLAPIQNSLAILERTAPGSEQAKRSRTIIGRQVAHLTRLVDDLLDVTRIERGKIRLQREPIDLNSIVRRAADDYRASFSAYGVTLEVQTGPEPVYIDGDPIRMSQVAGNLLANAAKFTPRGGRAVLRLRAIDDSNAELVVSDTGVGMSQSTLDHLFEPFTQAEKTLDRSRGGLGLGLTLVKVLVELHGGTVMARSAGLGYGAEILVRLPTKPRVAVAPNLEPSEDRTRTYRRVLVIEDNIDAGDSLKEALELEGHTVELARAGPEGLTKARIFKPDVVLCDIGLPGMNGFEIARTMRSDPELRSTYLVALTGYASREDVERARQAGFARHVPKPPDLGMLTRTIDDAAQSQEHAR